jgi:hypothetical protein
MACQGYDYFETGKVPNYKHLQTTGVIAKSKEVDPTLLVEGPPWPAFEWINSTARRCRWWSHPRCRVGAGNECIDFQRTSKPDGFGWWLVTKPPPKPVWFCDASTATLPAMLVVASSPRRHATA